MQNCSHIIIVIMDEACAQHGRRKSILTNLVIFATQASDLLTLIDQYRLVIVIALFSWQRTEVFLLGEINIACKIPRILKRMMLFM